VCYCPALPGPLMAAGPVAQTVPRQLAGDAVLIVSAKAVGGFACVSPIELDAVTLIVAEPEAVGVPLSTHELDRVKPAGTPVAVHVMGVSPAENANVWL